MSLKSFLKEHATWESRADKPNEYGKYAYFSRGIRCKIEDKTQLLRTPQGETFFNYSKVFTCSLIKVGDKINGRDVVSVNQIKDGRKVIGVEAILKMTNLNKLFSTLETNIVQAVADSLTESVTTIAEQSLTQAPMDTGKMRDSMEITADNQLVGIGDKSEKVEMNQLRFKKNKHHRIKIAYTADYSIYPHEIPFNNYTTYGTKWKYLEDPFNRNVKRIKSDLVKAIQKGGGKR